MLRPPVQDVAWVERVLEAGVRLDLFDSADDYSFALLGATIMCAVSNTAPSDEDAYLLLVRFWKGDWPQTDWPRHAGAVARRCATALAHTGTCELDSLLCAPSETSLQCVEHAIIADLGLTTRQPLGALAERWEDVADFEMPIDGWSLLAFASMSSWIRSSGRAR